MKYFIVSFDRSPTAKYGSFHDDFVAHPKIRRWSHHIKSNYLVGTDFSVSGLSQHFRSTALKHNVPTRHIVLAVNLKVRSGWMPKEAWEWISRQTDGE